jgi:hypothetical protein
MKRTPGAGERAARGGFRYQDRASAVVAYQAILDGSLTFLALADDHAGMFDDFVIGIAGKVVGHQYKSSGKPKGVGVRGLLLGTDAVIADCAKSFTMLERQFPKGRVLLRYVSVHYAATGDTGKLGAPGKDSADFFQEKKSHPDRSLAEWRAGSWKTVVEELLQASGLAELDFERFFNRLEIVLGAPATIEANHGVDAAARRQIEALALTLGDLVGRGDGKTHWTRRELLDELGWADRFHLRFEHRFPLGAHVQSNEASEAELEAALATHKSGYISLLGSPGAGKSTLLERFVRSGPDRDVARYLAFVPGEAQGQGRGVEANFLDDVNSQLASLGHQPGRAKDDTVEQKRETFERLLRRAGQQHAASGKRTVIVIDGLDHVPREEKPADSFLRALPLPQSLPDGVTILLGSQRIDLADIPGEVRDQASQDGRRIAIAALSERAVADMAASVGLDARETDPARVFAVSQGHPLVTRYLLGKLLEATPEQRDALLAGGFEYDGDLEKVYRQAWREARNAGDEVARVLFALSFADGRIEPELLAQWLSSAAVDKAFRLAHHLIDHEGPSWRIFHNSFRLFLRQQGVTLYGRPDPDFSDVAIYRKLAGLARAAPRASAQRFLEFRYLFLAGDHREAAALASRRHFIDQFIDGRRNHDVSHDIGDAVACLGPDPAPDALLDLMLAKDEVWRRQDVLSTSDRLVPAQIATGELDTAVAQLDSSHFVGDEWLVIDALLEGGHSDRARHLFDDENPWKWFEDGHSQDTSEAMENWAKFAVVLLDDDQIERRIRIPTGRRGDDRDGFSGRTRDQHTAELRHLLARAILRDDPDKEVAEVAARHGIGADSVAILHLKAAEASLEASRQEAATQRLADYEAATRTARLHDSWDVHAARIGIAAKDVALANRLFARATVPDLAGLEHSSTEVEEATSTLLRYASTAAQLGLGPIQPAPPKETLFRGAQNHAIRLGGLIGTIRAGRQIPVTEVSGQIRSSMNFLAAAIADRRDDALLDYRIRHVDKPIFGALCELVRLVPDAAPGFATAFEACLLAPVCSFGDNAHLHRRYVETMFAFDGDAAQAVARLERMYSWLEGVRSPQEVVDLLAEVAIAFANVGLRERGVALLREMRSRTLGAYLPAKKDGQYELWEGLLAAANRSDPEKTAERAFKMLRFTAGVENSDAHDQARRMSKSVLVEAMAGGLASARAAYRWAKSSGVWHWDALVDAVARGMLRRRPDLALPLAIAWGTLCAPYYEESYHSLTDDGQFLRDLAAAAAPDQLPLIERAVVTALERDARPQMRSKLLRTFRDGLADRSRHSPLVNAAVRRWNEEPAHDGSFAYDDEPLADYYQLQDFAEVENAVAAVREWREAQTSTSYGDFVNRTLGKRIGRIIAGSSWEEVQAFAVRNPRLVRDRPVRNALAKAALAAGDRAYAEALFPKSDDEHQGWGGWADTNLLNHHRARHLMGDANAHRNARRDFLRDLATGGHGTGSALAGAADIFPLLFEEVDWPTLWSRLEEQIVEYHDYRKEAPVPHDEGDSGDDFDLIVRLFVDAARLGISDPRSQAGEGLAALAQQGGGEIFKRACRDLLADPSTTLFALRLLFEARNRDGVADAFGQDVVRLTAHPDGGVAVLAQMLGRAWGDDAGIPEVDLPPIYSLQLPPLDTTARGTLRDEESLGPVIDDPGAWTEGFESWLEMAERFSGVPIQNVRRRVAQLINGWGGAERFGAKATEELRKRINPLGLLIPFVRPHIGACIQALRVIVGDLLRAKRLSRMEFDLLLHRLDGGPLLPAATIASARPSDSDWPLPPEGSWNTRAEDWLQAENLKRLHSSDRVIGEWASFSRVESRSLFREDLLFARGAAIGAAASLDAAIGQLPKAFWACRNIMLDDANLQATIRVLRVSLVGERSEILTFDPTLAQEVGWQPSGDGDFTFVDDGGLPMVTTIFWRDGWEQEMRHGGEVRWAEGQRVELTEPGLARLLRRGDLPEAQLLRWRHLETRHPEKRSSSSWRSEAKGGGGP